MDDLHNRVFPLEQSVGNMVRELSEIKTMLETRDADLQAAERRFEELALQMKELEKKMQLQEDVRSSGGSDDGSNVHGKNNLKQCYILHAQEYSVAYKGHSKTTWTRRGGWVVSQMSMIVQVG